jgi:hypothetical protein
MPTFEIRVDKKKQLKIHNYTELLRVNAITMDYRSKILRSSVGEITKNGGVRSDYSSIINKQSMINDLRYALGNTGIYDINIYYLLGNILLSDVNIASDVYIDGGSASPGVNLLVGGSANSP